MGLKFFVKVTNISNLSDARYCAGMMVDLLGFNVNPQDEECVSPELFQEITGWVAGIKTVGEFGNCSPELIAETCAQYQLDYVQVNKPEQLKSFGSVDMPVILKIEISSEDGWITLPETISQLNDQVKMVIIRCEKEEFYEDLDMQLQRIASQHSSKFIKSYNLSEVTAGQIDTDVFYGIELSGSQEERPGFNDYGELMDILEVLEED